MCLPNVDMLLEPTSLMQETITEAQFLQRLESNFAVKLREHCTYVLHAVFTLLPFRIRR